MVQIIGAIFINIYAIIIQVYAGIWYGYIPNFRGAMVKYLPSNLTAPPSFGPQTFLFLWCSHHQITFGTTQNTLQTP